MAFDLSRLRRGEQIAAAGAVLLFIFLFFFDWYGVGGDIGGLAESFGVDASVSGWDAHELLRWLMLLTIVGGLGLAFLTATQRTVALPVTAAVIATAVAALTTLLVAYRVLLNEPGPNDVLDVEIGAWLGLIACAIVTYGGYLSMREEGTSIGDAKEQARAAFDSATTARPGEPAASAPPPPPPPPPAAAAPAPPVSEPPAAAPSESDDEPAPPSASPPAAY